MFYAVYFALLQFLAYGVYQDWKEAKNRGEDLSKPPE